MNDDCTKEEVCVHENGNSIMKATSFNGCSDKQSCDLVDGKKTCVCKEGFMQNGDDCEGTKQILSFVINF